MSNDRQNLEDRVAELRGDVDRLRHDVSVLQQAVVHNLRSSPRGIRRRSEATVFGWPLWEVAIGPDPERGEIRGHARAIFARGDIATGVFAVGGVARGIFAFGSLAIGLVSFGGCAIGLLLAVGGGAVGGVALGGGAVGLIAVGGGAAGIYALGGGAVGVHTISPLGADPQAVQFFNQWIPGLQQLLPQLLPPGNALPGNPPPGNAPPVNPLGAVGG